MILVLIGRRRQDVPLSLGSGLHGSGIHARHRSVLGSASLDSRVLASGAPVRVDPGPVGRRQTRAGSGGVPASAPR